jgi:PAS domain S-box-containing protein
MKRQFPEKTGDARVGVNRVEKEEPCMRFDDDWENVFNSITDMVTIHDIDFNIICANKAAEKVLGLPALNINKAKCFEYYHGTECPPEGCPSCRCMKTGEPAAFEIFEPHLNMYVEIRAIPRLDRDNKLIGLIHIVRDITGRRKAAEELERHRFHLEEMVDERSMELKGVNEKLQLEIDEHRRAEEALREGEEKYRRLFESANDSIFIIDPETRRFLDVNENACKRLDYARDELLGLTIDDIDTPMAASRNDAFIRELRERGSVVFEHAHRRRDGTEVPVEISSRVIEYGGRKVFQSFVRDIAGRKRAEKEREELIVELRKALDNVKTLRGLIPICAWCKKVRDDKGYWRQVEDYVSEHSDADFTHGICRECMEKVRASEEEEKRK